MILFGHIKPHITKSMLKVFLFSSLIFCCYQTIVPLPDFPSTEELSLSVGREMGSIIIAPAAMITSKDGKLLYTFESMNKVLKVIDISNIKAPKTISLLSIFNDLALRYFSTLYLSEDEKTLFASNFHYLHIIDISNPRSPKLLAAKEDPAAIEDLYDRVAPQLYQPNIAISEDKKTLYVAGLGLQTFNIANYSDPILLESSMKDDELSSTSVAVIENTLLLIDETLQVFDISNLTKRLSITQFETVHPASSIVLANDKKIAYTLCFKLFTSIKLEKIDLSDLRSPSRIKTYDLGFQSKGSPIIIATSPCNRYIFISILTSFKLETELRVFDTVDEKVLYHNNSLIKSALALTFIPNTNYIASSTQKPELNTKFFELYPNFLDRSVFSLSEGAVEKFPIKEVANSMQFSNNRQIMFISTGNAFFTSPSSIEILNVSNFSSITTLGSYAHQNASEKIQSMFVSEDNTKAIFYATGGIRILDISADYSSFTPLGYQNHSDSMQDWIVSSDAKTIITLRNEQIFEEDSKGNLRGKSFANFLIFDASDPTKIIQIASIYEQTATHYFKFALSKNEKTLYVAHTKLEVYDLTDLSNPKKLTSSSYNDGNTIEFVHTCITSPDETILALRITDGNYLCKLKFFDISNPSQPVFLSEITVPVQLKGNFGMKDSIFSLDGSFIYTVQEQSLLIIDISEIHNPKIFGVIPNLAFNNLNAAASMQIDSDGKTINLIDYQGTFYRMSVQFSENLYLKQESFRLGEKYSDTLEVLNQNPAKEYDLLSTDQYRLIKSHLLTFKMAKSQFSATQVQYSLPYWMHIDTENNLLTIEPKTPSDIDSYTLCSSFSFKLPRTAFTSLETLLPNSTDSKDLIANLIGMGYLDNQLFITSNFGSLEDFFLPKIYRDLEKNIYQVIKSYYRETCTKFEVLPSLEFILLQNELVVKTPSLHAIKINIQLESHGRFLSKSYGLLQPILAKDSSSITLEGSLKEVNAALKELVIDLPTATSETCHGTIMIDDRLNPTIMKDISNISSYLIRNENPLENQNNLLQNQISRVSIYTGQYFTININETTFIDKNADKLAYTIVMNDTERSNLPLWLTFNYPDLKGTPPEEILKRDYDLLMIVRNEFKYIEVPFTLHAKISSVFAIKLVVRYSPYILTILGFVIYASKIYNIIFKKHYKHPKVYLIKHGEEITPNVILPIMFIAEEIKEKELIWKYFLKTMAVKLNAKSPNGSKIIAYFIEESTGNLNKRKVFEAVQEAMSTIPVYERRQLHLCLSEDEHRKACLFQLFINELVEWQLNLSQEHYTKMIFDQIKDQCYDLVEFNDTTIFAVNQTALQRFLKNDLSIDSQENNLKEKLLIDSNKINVDLLENALISFMFKHQTLECHPLSVKVAIKQRKHMNFVSTFLKQDFKETHIIDYGLSCKIKNSMLLFSGTPNKDFGRKTVVVQISTGSQRILKELWITGMPNHSKVNDSTYQFDISRSLHKSYEVL